VTVAGNSNGTAGANANELYWLAGILFNSNDNMYLADRDNNRMQFWPKGSTTGIKDHRMFRKIFIFFNLKMNNNKIFIILKNEFLFSKQNTVIKKSLHNFIE
jgi:hypothetical protein